MEVENCDTMGFSPSTNLVKVERNRRAVWMLFEVAIKTVEHLIILPESGTGMPV